MSGYENFKAHREALRELEGEAIASLDDVRERVRLIGVIGPDDDEEGHACEDRLHTAVLRAIASGGLSGEFCGELAREALKTLDIEFARWCA